MARPVSTPVPPYLSLVRAGDCRVLPRPVRGARCHHQAAGSNPAGGTPPPAPEHSGGPPAVWPVKLQYSRTRWAARWVDGQEGEESRPADDSVRRLRRRDEDGRGFGPLDVRHVAHADLVQA